MSTLWWSVLGIIIGAFLTFIVNLLTHRVNINQERALLQADRLTLQCEETHRTLIILTRDMSSAQTTLSELQHAMQQHQIRLISLEEKVGVVWRSIEGQLEEILRGKRQEHNG